MLNVLLLISTHVRRFFCRFITIWISQTSLKLVIISKSTIGVKSKGNRARATFGSNLIDASVTIQFFFLKNFVKYTFSVYWFSFLLPTSFPLWSTKNLFEMYLNLRVLSMRQLLCHDFSITTNVSYFSFRMRPNVILNDHRFIKK